MPLTNLTDDELSRAAQALRALAHKHEDDARKNASTRSILDEQARACRNLAERFEGLRRTAR